MSISKYCPSFLVLLVCFNEHLTNDIVDLMKFY
uniref:Uncharacterized protein n=1 Tax=Arundo donax TaxID=35708 RepID=A0A0A9BQ60_ARUDO